MRAFFLLLATCVFSLSSAARALDEAPSSPPAASDLHPSTDAVKKELTAIIESQLAAFRADDYVKAYTFAASEIQGMFAVNEFEVMVKKGYPAIAHSGVVEFGLSFDTGEDAVVNVRIEDKEKRSALYQYQLKKQDGKWKIGGVSELRSSSISV